MFFGALGPGAHSGEFFFFLGGGRVCLGCSGLLEEGPELP